MEPRFAGRVDGLLPFFGRVNAGQWWQVDACAAEDISAENAMRCAC